MLLRRPTARPPTPVASAGAAPEASRKGRPLAVISGGSASGMVAGIAAAKAGFAVDVVESHDTFTRNAQIFLREATLTELRSIDEGLYRAIVAATSEIDPNPVRALNLDQAQEFPRFDVARLGEATYRSQLRGKGIGIHSPALGRAVERGSTPPRTGKEVVLSPLARVAPLRTIEAAVKRYVLTHFADRVRLVRGKVVAQRKPDGNVELRLETRQKGRTQATTPWSRHPPAMVLGVEGSKSQLRTALAIETAPTTPAVWWTAGAVPGLFDRETQRPGQATVRALHGELAGVRVDAEATSDGRTATWITSAFPLGDRAPQTVTKAEINDHFVREASVLMHRSPATLRHAGVEGSAHVPGSRPTLFQTQGQAARSAARVTPNGTVFGLLGDAAHVSHFHVGGGENIALSEAEAVKTLATDLRRGRDRVEASQQFESSVLEYGDAWGFAGVPYFYEHLRGGERRELLQKLWQESLDAWRKNGGPTPHERLATRLQALPDEARPMPYGAAQPAQPEVSHSR